MTTEKVFWIAVVASIVLLVIAVTYPFRDEENRKYYVNAAMANVGWVALSVGYWLVSHLHIS